MNIKTKKLFVLFIVLIGSTSSFTEAHKFYVSVTQIDYNQKQQSLQIISRIFIDDIENVLRERYDRSIRLATGKNENQIDTYLKKYLDQKLNITVNGKKVAVSFIGKEYESDLMLCYLEVEGIKSLQTITVSNAVLMDIFEEQQNIVHVSKGKKRKSLILQKEKDKDLLKFSK